MADYFTDSGSGSIPTFITITSVSSICIREIGVMNGTMSPFLFLRVPFCALCNRPVDEFERIDRPDIDGQIFRARCHGQTEEYAVTKEDLLSKSSFIQEMVSRAWFQDDYARLNNARPQIEQAATVPTGKPVRQINLK